MPLGEPKPDRPGDRGATAAAEPTDESPTDEPEPAMPAAFGSAAERQDTPASATAASGTSTRTSRRGLARRHVGLPIWLVAAIGAALLLLGGLIGGAIGAASQNSALHDKDSRISALEKSRDAAQKKVDDREAQRRADEAKTKRIDAEQQQKQQQAAADEQRRQQQAAAEEQKRQQDQANAAAAAEAKKNTVPSGGGVFAIGQDINPGRWSTPGPDGSNGAGCYYAILNSPDTTNIATNNIANGQAVTDLPVGKFFDTSGCQTWTKTG